MLGGHPPDADAADDADVDDNNDEAGWVTRTGTRLTLNRRAESARLYERSP
jgi:hypothetical protein